MDDLRCRFFRDPSTIRLDFGASGRVLAPGVYFLRARDSAGQLSNVARLVLVR